MSGFLRSHAGLGRSTRYGRYGLRPAVQRDAAATVSRKGRSGGGLDGRGDRPDRDLRLRLIPLLQADDRVAKIIGIARRPFDPAEYGWTKMEYRRGDVRDPEALQEAFGQADVVVHLAFMITGVASPEAIRAVSSSPTAR